MTIEKTYRLYYRHHGKRYSHSRYALGIDASHEIGVGEIVHTRRQHADDGRNRHRENNLVHRSFGQECIIISCFLHCEKSVFFFFLTMQRYYFIFDYRPIMGFM